MGGLVAAATAGVLLGFGVRTGDLFRRINLTATLLLGDRAERADGFAPLVTTIGLVVHIGWAILTGILFAAAFPRLRGARLYGAAAGAGIVLLLLQRTAMPWIGGATRAEPLSTPQSILLWIAVALALAMGMRLALSSSERP